MNFYLHESRNDPINLPALEQRRWDIVQKHHKIMYGPWKEMIQKMHKAVNFWGYKDQSGLESKYCFQISEGGINRSSVYPGNPSFFVQCMTDEELPMYVNDKNEQIRIYLNQRLKGLLPVFPHRQDLASLCFKNEKKIYRCLRVISMYDEIILNHMRLLWGAVTKHGTIAYHSRMILTFTINERKYLFKNGELIVKPEDLDAFEVKVTPKSLTCLYDAPEKRKTFAHNIRKSLPLMFSYLKGED